jgi:broad specificity phosphatase PhoE
MSSLIFVRHGHARSFETDSDQLSLTGEVQARALAKFWIDQNQSFNEAYCGTLKRQRQTAEIAGSCFNEAGMSWPHLQTTPELNEYDAHGMINLLIPALAKRDSVFRDLVIDFEEKRNSPERNRSFQKMFEAVTAVWQQDEIEVDGVESWSTFSSRVRAFLKRIITHEKSGRRIVVFTSGGVIGLIVQTTLSAPEIKTLDINWRIRNCSLTEFVFSRGRLSLDSFNSTPHLNESSLITYR